MQRRSPAARSRRRPRKLRLRAGCSDLRHLGKGLVHLLPRRQWPISDCQVTVFRPTAPAQSDGSIVLAIDEDGGHYFKRLRVADQNTLILESLDLSERELHVYLVPLVGETAPQAADYAEKPQGRGRKERGKHPLKEMPTRWMRCWEQFMKIVDVGCIRLGVIGITVLGTLSMTGSCKRAAPQGTGAEVHGLMYAEVGDSTAKRRILLPDVCADRRAMQHRANAPNHKEIHFALQQCSKDRHEIRFRCSQNAASEWTAHSVAVCADAGPASLIASSG